MDGIIVLDKPTGITSHDCVQKVKKSLKVKKCGHTGTLDPLATGVLPICIGKATRLVQFLQSDDKEYICETLLGKSTDTGDVEGKILNVDNSNMSFNRDLINNVLQSFLGNITQTVPKYSAIKINGKKLYEYARSGIEVELPKRDVTIYNIELVDNFNEISGMFPSFKFKVKCSKGTYIRSLVEDIGKKLNTVACMSNLRRTQSGLFTIDRSYSIDDLHDIDNLKIISESEIIEKIMPIVEVPEDIEFKVLNGALLSGDNFPNEMFAFYKNGKCISIYDKHPTKINIIKPIRVFS